MPLNSHEELKRVIESRIRYFEELTSYLSEIKQGQIDQNEISIFMQDVLGIRVPDNQPLVLKRLLATLARTVSINLREYKEFNDCFEIANKEIGMSVLAILLQVKLECSREEKSIYDHNSSLYSKPTAVLHQLDIIKLLNNLAEQSPPERFDVLRNHFRIINQTSKDKSYAFFTHVKFDFSSLERRNNTLINQLLQICTKDTALEEKLLQGFQQGYQKTATLQEVIELTAQATPKPHRPLSQRNQLRPSPARPIVDRSDNQDSSMFKTVVFNVTDFYQISSDGDKLQATLSLKELFDAQKRQQALLSKRYAISQSVIEAKKLSLLERCKKIFHPEIETYILQINSISLITLIEGLTVDILQEFSNECFRVLSTIDNNITSIEENLKLQAQQYEAERTQKIALEKEKQAAEIQAFFAKREQALQARKTIIAENRKNASTEPAPAPPSEQTAIVSVNQPLLDRLTNLNQKHIDLIISILKKDNGIKYADVCHLIENQLDGSIEEIGNGSSHKRIRLNALYSEIYTTCDNRIITGGMFRQHQRGHNENVLSKFNLKLIGEAFYRAGFTLDKMNELMNSRQHAPSLMTASA